MATRNTGTVTEVGNANRTATHLSTNIIIKVGGGDVVGAVKSLEITESRDIAMVDEVGTDGHIDSAPRKSTDVTGRCTRTRFDKKRIAQAFDRGFVHVKSQRVPFDIEIHDIFHDSDLANAIITTIKNVWMRDISYTYSSDDFIIVDNMSWTAEDIFSILAGNNVANAGDSPNVYINQHERTADRGVYRGALDAAGLLNSFLET